jgi:hypothetical protein
MIDARQRLRLPAGESKTYYSLPRLEKSGAVLDQRLAHQLETARTT